MPDLLVRGLGADVLAEVDRLAGEQGLSRQEFLHRRLTSQYTPRKDATIQPADWARLGRLAADLADPDVMSQAWS